MTLEDLEQFLCQYPALGLSNAAALRLVELLHNSRSIVLSLMVACHDNLSNEDARRLLRKLDGDMQ